MEKNPRVLIGCPTHELKEDSLEDYLLALRNLSYQHFDVILEDNSPTKHYYNQIKSLGEEWLQHRPQQSFRVEYSGETSKKARDRLVQGRNKIRNIALKEGYDYFLSLEQDVIPPKDIIERLLKHEKKIVSGTYYNKNTHDPNNPTISVMAGIHLNRNEKEHHVVHSLGFLQLFPSRLLEVAYTGLGCMLIRRDVLEKIEFRYNPENLACDDIYFCMDAEDKNIPIYLDTSTLCKHEFNNAFKLTEY